MSHITMVRCSLSFGMVSIMIPKNGDLAQICGANVVPQMSEVLIEFSR